MVYKIRNKLLLYHKPLQLIILKANSKILIFLKAIFLFYSRIILYYILIFKKIIFLKNLIFYS